MGAKCSPIYGNIYMGTFEKDYICTLLIANNITCYYRFIDDIFFIWNNSETALNKAFLQLNQVHPSIKFVCKYSYKQTNFLDTTICIKGDLTLTTKLFKKDTDRNAYLHYRSYQPGNTKNHIPYGQVLRAKRICTKEVDLKLVCLLS